MANFNMNPFALTALTPAGLPSADQGYGGVLKAITAQLTYASQASGSTFTIGTIPAGSCFIGGFLSTDTSTGSTTLAVGGTLGGAQAFQANCYKAAAAITTVDVPQWFIDNVSATHSFFAQLIAGATAGLQPYAAAETFKITTAAATAPASGNLFACLVYM